MSHVCHNVSRHCFNVVAPLASMGQALALTEQALASTGRPLLQRGTPLLQDIKALTKDVNPVKKLPSSALEEFRAVGEPLRAFRFSGVQRISLSKTAGGEKIMAKSLLIGCSKLCLCRDIRDLRVSLSRTFAHREPRQSTDPRFDVWIPGWQVGCT